MSIELLEKRLGQWGVRHFTPWELTVQRQTGVQAVPTCAQVENIKGAVIVADSIREAFGAAISCRSGLRSREYNNSLPGASPTSEHLEFKAMDLQPLNPTPENIEEMRKIAVATVDLLQRRKRELEEMGKMELAAWLNLDVRIIHYNRFVHIDCNAAPGKPRIGLDNR